MRKSLLIFALLMLIGTCSIATETAQVAINSGLTNSDVVVYSEKNLFGLKDKEGNIIVKPEYRKLIRLGDSAWIIQKKYKFGLMNNSGEILVEPKYRHVDRIFGKYLKIGNENDFAVYNEKGEIIIPPEYTSIDPLFGGMFLTCKNYKYGVVDMEGNTIIANKFDDIYMPKPNVMRIKFLGEWFEIEHTGAEELALPDNLAELENSKEFTISTIITDTGVISGYSVLTFTDYLIKIFSTISPAHEDTIDELMLSQGADTVSIFMQLGWIPKYPITYVKKYYYNFRNPNNGPLSDVRNELKQKL